MRENGMMVPGNELGLDMRTMTRDRDEGNACRLMRAPTDAFPPFVQTIDAAISADGTAVFELRADRDLLLTDFTVSDRDGFIDVEYCNTKLLVHSASDNWLACCMSRPPFLQGVRDNKTLKVVQSGLAAQQGTARATFYGFQGNGCCG